MSHKPELVGIKDIAARAGYSKDAVIKWVRKPSFPKPVQVISGRRAWSWPAVRLWIRREPSMRKPRVA